MSDLDDPTTAPPPMDDANAFEDEAVLIDQANAEAEAEAANGEVTEEANGAANDDDMAEPITISAGEDVTSAILGSGQGTMENLRMASTPSPSPSVPRIEPETIRIWREKQQELLNEKDKKEEEQMEELREQAKKELQDWYKKYEEQLSKTKDDNRSSEKTFVAEMDEIQPGTEWDRVTKLCEFNAKNSKNAKDMSRMRSILLQLKQNPKPVLAK